MRKRVRALFLLLLAASLMLTGVFATAAFAADTVTQTSLDDFTSGMGGTSRQNNNQGALTEAQSKIERIKGADGGYYAVFSPTEYGYRMGNGTNPGHAFVQNNFTSSGVKLDSASGNKYLVYELDFTTETQYSTNLMFELIARNTADSANVFVKDGAKVIINSDGNGGFNLTMNGVTVPIESEKGKWQHLTLIVESVRNSSGGVTAASKVYWYYNGRYVSSLENAFKSDILKLANMRISVNKGVAINLNDTFCIDNVRTSVVKENNSAGLAAILADSTKSLTEWSESYYKTDYTFPKTQAIAASDNKLFSTASEIEAEIAANPGVEFTLLGNLIDSVDISGECSFYNPNGYTFNYNKGSMNEYSTSATKTFVSEGGQVEVVWNILGEQVKQTYSIGGAIAAPEYESEFEKDGKAYKITAFSKTAGGEPVVDFGTATKYNTEFYAIITEAMASITSTNGNKVFIYSETDLDSAFSTSKSGDTVTLFNDVTFGASGASAYTFTGKSVTFDLGGHTATIAKLRSGHIFTLGAGGSLTVKNGVLNGRDNGRIPEGEQSIVRRNIFKINNNATGAVLVAEDLVIEATKMMAAIGNGSATFRNCTIDFTHDYENMIDLYSNGNEANPTKLIIEGCDIKGYKTLINTYKPSEVNSNWTEIEISNSTLVTDERIVASAALSKATLNGGYFDGKYIFSGTSANANARVEIYRNTGFAIKDIDETDNLFFVMDGKLVRTDNKDYPYVVTDKYAKISWDVVGNTVSELWAKGSIPECPVEIPANTRAVRYDVDAPVPVTGYKLYKVEANINFVPKISYSFGYDFGLSVYVPESVYQSIKLDNREYDSFSISERLTKVAIDSEAYYKLDTVYLTAENATDEVTLEVCVNAAGSELRCQTQISLLDYIDAILSSDMSLECYNLALSALGYIDCEADKTSEKLSAMLGKYDVSRVLYPIANMDSADALESILSEWRFENNLFVYSFKSDFTGVVTVEFINGVGELQTMTFDIVNGKDGASDGVVAGLPIYALAGGYKISSGDVTGYLGIGAYAKKTADTDSYMALYSYAKSAEAYYNSIGGND